MVVNDVFPNGEASHSLVNLVTFGSCFGSVSEEDNDFSNRIHDSVCDVNAAGLCGDPVPDIINIPFRWSGKRECVSLSSGLAFVGLKPFAATGLNMFRELLNVAFVEVRVFASFNSFEPGANIPPKRFKSLVPIPQKSQSFTNDLARGLVHSSTDLIVHKLFQFGRQRDVHGGPFGQRLTSGYD